MKPAVAFFIAPASAAALAATDAGTAELARRAAGGEPGAPVGSRAPGTERTK